MSRFQLQPSDAGLGLVDTWSAQRPLIVDFGEPAFVKRLERAGRKNELIARAVKLRPGLSVLDCTAGLGREAFLLAHLGCEVTMVERSAVIGELLADGLKRAQESRVADTAARLTLRVGDAAETLKHDTADYDVICLDPMFPEKSGSAAVGGQMQILQRFIGVDEDAADLLSLALMRDTRVVLKRPGKGHWQSPISPVHVFESRNACYEVFGV